MTEMATVDAMLVRVAAARAEIEAIADLDTAREWANRAAGAAEYLNRAVETRHLANRANEIRVWAERRAGRFLLDEGVVITDCAHRAREIGTNAATVRRWMRFAFAEKRIVEATIKELIDTRDLTVGAVERRLETRRLTRLERGIYENYLGDLILRWRERGRTHQLTLRGVRLPEGLPVARERLLIVTGRAKLTGASPLADDDLADVYASVRRLLQQVERIRAQGDTPLRSLMAAAIQGLYVAEDNIGRALREASS